MNRPGYTRACVFCQILAGEQPASFVCRDARVAAFMDIQPVNPGHVLIVPARHAARLCDMPADTASALMRVAHGLVAAIPKSGIKCEGVNLFLADGPIAFQGVDHVHLHVIPRFQGDGFGLKFGPEYGRRPAREELARLSDQLRLPEL